MKDAFGNRLGVGNVVAFAVSGERGEDQVSMYLGIVSIVDSNGWYNVDYYDGYKWYTEYNANETQVLLFDIYNIPDTYYQAFKTRIKLIK